MSKERESLFASLHDVGWFGLSGEMQDALIEAGYHPGPKGGCSRRIGNILRTGVGYCGTDGYCPACWADRNPRLPQADRQRPDGSWRPANPEPPTWDGMSIAQVGDRLLRAEAERDEARERIQRNFEHFNYIAAKAEAEVARLREALEEYADLGSDEIPYADTINDPPDIGRVARAALAPKEDA